MLRSFSAQFPHWQLAGSELSDRFRQRVLSIPRVSDFYGAPLDTISAQFDLITMLHVLEHVERPVQLLANAARLLRTGGRILIQVPNLLENPFDVLVADHCSHFIPTVLLQVVRGAGLRVTAWSSNWVTKELSVVAAAPSDAAAPNCESAAPSGTQRSGELAAGHVRWLHGLVEHGRRLARQARIGVFGTSIAGTWMAAELGTSVGFFVDEDQTRIGGRHLGLPILSAAEVPRDNVVLIVLPPGIAAHVHQRVQARHQQARFVAPEIPHAA
jgi:hypothetical protein